MSSYVSTGRFWYADGEVSPVALTERLIVRGILKKKKKNSLSEREIAAMMSQRSVVKRRPCGPHERRAFIESMAPAWTGVQHAFT